MTKPKFKSDARPSDTKSVVLHKENDKRLLDHLQTIKRESEFWRHAGYFYLDFMEWLASQGDAPEPNRPFVYYRAWLEQRLQSPTPGPQPPLDLSQVINDSLAAHLADVRQVVQSALDNFTIGPPIPPAELLNESDEVADLLAGLDMNLEVEEL